MIVGNAECLSSLLRELQPASSPAAQIRPQLSLCHNGGRVQGRVFKSTDAIYLPVRLAKLQASGSFERLLLLQVISIMNVEAQTLMSIINNINI